MFQKKNDFFSDLVANALNFSRVFKKAQFSQKRLLFSWLNTELFHFGLW